MMKLKQSAIQELSTHTTPHQCATDNNSGDLPPDKRHPFNLSESEFKRQRDNGHKKNEDTQTPGTKPNKESRFPIASAIGKSQYKPVGGSGWLNKYTSWKSTKEGSVEYPRTKEDSRAPNNLKHWYWRYCWRHKGSKIESIGCPRKKVRAVEQAIAAKIPHKEIYNFIVEDKSAPPTT
ncbi:MAG: hypothetical protein F6K22_03705 [Okeania sp. SIO2F4]|uniref:hypothetical protein n=1 Tax=Okeania sp. SIO2F4 TaxID=2607790 RepID=UPI00142B331B|nr:hypothetical protein [Okeania sp. SIO2F4]NES02010.1 hypothetical protein [Okeania sp. SIO2F4]